MQWSQTAGARKSKYIAGVHVLGQERTFLCLQFLKSLPWAWGLLPPPASLPPSFCSLGKRPPISPIYPAPLSFHRMTFPASKKTPSSLVRAPSLPGDILPAQGKSKFISFHAMRRYGLHIVLMQCIITETALQICIFYLCFITPRIFPNSFLSTRTSLKYILASFMSSWNWIANSYCNENTYVPAWWYTTLHSNYGCALINLNWRVLSLNCW